jgi:hypothetical protein
LQKSFIIKLEKFMSNLLKSKFFLGVMIVAVLLVGVVGFTSGVKTAAASTLAITHTLKVGSTYKAEVEVLQSAIGVTADGSFGPKTKAAVEAWQKTAGLTADGVFGPKSLAALEGGSMMSTLPAGCSSTSGFSATTGASCGSGVMTTLPAGCVSTSGFSSTTGVSCSTGVSTTQSGPITVSLSQDNPAAGYVIAGQATADLAHFTLTGNGVLNSITLQRTGISDQNTLANVYLYNGNVRLTDGYSFNNSSVLTMNNLGIVVNGSLEISVKADISSTAGTTASTVGVAVTGLTAGTTATSANVAGNMMYVGVGSPASVYLPTQASVAVPSASVNAGTSSYTVWSAPVQVNTRAVLLKGANFRMVGSAPVGALANIHLYVDGAQVGNVANVGAINGSNYAMFDFSGAPVSLSTGSHTVDVRADIVSGSSYTVQVSLQQAADLVVFDPQLGINVAPAVSSSVAFSSNNAGTITINAGSASVVVDPTFSAMTTVTGGATQVDIAKFKVHGYGEDVKVSTLSVTPVLGSMTPSAAGLNNLSIYFNGAQVGSSQAWTSGAATFNLGSQLIIPAATDSTIEVKADLQSTASVNYTAGTVAATLNVGSSNGQGQTSHTTLNFPTSQVVGTSLTVQTGLLAVSKNSSYTNQVVNPNTASVKIGSFVLQNQSTSEAVNVTGLKVALAFATPTFTSGTLTTGTQTWTLSSTSGITVGNTITPTTIVGGGTSVMTVTSVPSGTTVTGTVAATGITTSASGAILATGSTTLATLTNFSNLRTSETSGSGATPVQPTGNDNFSVNFQLAPGTTKTIDVLADTSTANMGAVTATLTVTSLGANSHVAITQTGAGTGQTITLGTSTLGTPTVVTSNTTTTEFIAAGSTTGVSQAAKVDFNVVASNGSATISELKFKNTSVNGAVTSVTVNGVTAPTVGDIAYLTGLNIPVTNGGAGADLIAYETFAPVGTTGIASGSTAALSLCSIKYTVGGTTTTSGDTTCALPLLAGGQTMTLVGSAPIVTAATPTGAVLGASSTVEAIDVTVAANAAGPIKVSSFNVVSSLTPASGSAFTAAAVVVKDASNNTVATSGSCTAAATCTVTVTFSTPYSISAGQSQTFKVFLPINTIGGTGTLPNTFMNTHLTAVASGTDFVWTDTAGNASITQGDATLIYNYPSTYTAQVHN